VFLLYHVNSFLKFVCAYSPVKRFPHRFVKTAQYSRTEYFRIRLRYKAASALKRINYAVSFKLLICLCDRIRIDSRILCKTPDTRNLVIFF